MTKKSEARQRKDALKKQEQQLAKERAKNPPVAHIDPLGDLARAELNKISEQEEEAALSGDGGNLWNDIEKVYRSCAMGLVEFLRTIAAMNDRNVLKYMRNPQQFIDRVTIFKADIKRFEQELNQIHDLHAHRMDDKDGQRETLAAMEISEHYTAWQARGTGILDKTMMELASMFDEAKRTGMALAAQEAAAQNVNVVTDVEFTEEARPVEDMLATGTIGDDYAAGADKFDSNGQLLAVEGEGQLLTTLTVTDAAMGGASLDIIGTMLKTSNTGFDPIPQE